MLIAVLPGNSTLPNVLCNAWLAVMEAAYTSLCAPRCTLTTYATKQVLFHLDPQVCQVTGAVPVTRMTLAALAAAQPGQAAGVRAVSLGMRRAMLLQPMIRQVGTHCSCA